MSDIIHTVDLIVGMLETAPGIEIDDATSCWYYLYTADEYQAMVEDDWWGDTGGYCYALTAPLDGPQPCELGDVVTLTITRARDEGRVDADDAPLEPNHWHGYVQRDFGKLCEEETARDLARIDALFLRATG